MSPPISPSSSPLFLKIYREMQEDEPVSNGKTDHFSSPEPDHVVFETPANTTRRPLFMTPTPVQAKSTLKSVHEQFPWSNKKRERIACTPVTKMKPGDEELAHADLKAYLQLFEEFYSKVEFPLVEKREYQQEVEGWKEKFKETCTTDADRHLLQLVEEALVKFKID